MSLLVPDYSSSSDEENDTPQNKSTVDPPSVVVPPAPAPSVAEKVPADTKTSVKKKRKVKKKTKTALYLPPEIQRLLESGVTGDDSDDDEWITKRNQSTLAKRPRKEQSAESRCNDESSVLSFLPAPKLELKEPKPVSKKIKLGDPIHKPEEDSGNAIQADDRQQQTVESSSVAVTHQYYPQGYDQSAQYYQQQQYYSSDYYPSYQGEEDDSMNGNSSKRARNRDRELERALQQGHFAGVADKIVEVQGPNANAWQPPVDQEKRNAEDLKVQASFWNTAAGATVSTAKPNRLQRQKHQLNQLAFDAKAREYELLDKKGVALKTKAETYAKYGW